MKERAAAKKIEFAVSSFPGSRDINEDCAGAWGGENGSLFCVADGLGGHGKGEIASAAVIKKAGKLFAESNGEVDLARIFEAGQAELMDIQRSTGEFSSFKTTLTVLSLKDGRARWGHIGDTRIYRFIGGGIPVRTLDHSVPQMLVLAGQLKEKNIRGNRDRNRLLRVMGIKWDEPKYELCEQPQPLLSGDAFLLCSDGFWEYIDEKKMTSLLAKAETPKAWLEAMNSEVAKNGKGKDMDNYTALAVICS